MNIQSEPTTISCFTCMGYGYVWTTKEMPPDEGIEDFLPVDLARKDDCILVRQSLHRVRKTVYFTANTTQCPDCHGKGEFPNPGLKY